MYEIEELDTHIRIMAMEKNDHETYLVVRLVLCTGYCPDFSVFKFHNGFAIRRTGERIIFTERLKWTSPYSRRTNRAEHVFPWR